MTHPPARTYSGWSILPPLSQSLVPLFFSEPPTPKLLWQQLERTATVADVGRGLFVGTLAERNAKWKEMRNFIRQARTYWDAASQTRGSSAALNFYYCFLNLAKAELLRDYPIDRLRRVRHGLSHKHSATGTLPAERVELTPGVFQMLYERRVGQPIASGTRLPVTRLIRQLPEVGLESQQLGIGIPLTIPGYHVVARDSTSAWPILGFTQNVEPWSHRPDREPVLRALNSAFERVTLGPAQRWRDLFAVSARSWPAELFVFQSRSTYSLDGQPDFVSAARVLRQAVGANVSDPIMDRADFLLSMSLFKSRRLDLPSPLARYVLIFWLSSVVRYRPSLLDPITRSSEAWIADSLAAETPVHLLAAALAGIQGGHVTFEHHGFRL